MHKPSAGDPLQPFERLFTQGSLALEGFVPRARHLNDPPNTFSSKVFRAVSAAFQKSGVDTVSALTVLLLSEFAAGNFNPWSLRSVYSVALRAHAQDALLNDIHIDQYDPLLTGRQVIQSPLSVWDKSAEALEILWGSNPAQTSGIFLRVAVDEPAEIARLAKFLGIDASEARDLI